MGTRVALDSRAFWVRTGPAPAPPGEAKRPRVLSSTMRLNGLNIPVLEEKWWRAAIRGRASYVWGHHGGTKTTNSFAR